MAADRPFAQVTAQLDALRAELGRLEAATHARQSTLRTQAGDNDAKQVRTMMRTDHFDAQILIVQFHDTGTAGA